MWVIPSCWVPFFFWGWCFWILIIIPYPYWNLIINYPISILKPYHYPISISYTISISHINIISHIIIPYHYPISLSHMHIISQIIIPYHYPISISYPISSFHIPSLRPDVVDWWWRAITRSHCVRPPGRYPIYRNTCFIPTESGQLGPISQRQRESRSNYLGPEARVQHRCFMESLWRIFGNLLDHWTLENMFFFRVRFW